MQDKPAGLDEHELRAALSEHWAIKASRLTYLTVGFGSYHWSVIDRQGREWFVKVDDLGAAEGIREDAFGQLSRSQQTALILRRDTGLGFVLAPVPSKKDVAVERLSQRYALTVFPMVEGVAGEFGPHQPQHLPDLAGLISALHRATPAVAHLAPHADLALLGRDGLTAAIAEVDRPWNSGPYAQAARELLTRNKNRVRGWLTRFDELVETVGQDRSNWVVTHGEPHPGNVLHTSEGMLLIDWATVQIAPPERDLWMLTDAFTDLLGEPPTGADAQVRARYGHDVSAAAIALYRLWWPLADIAAFLDDLRRPHSASEDSAAALHYLALNLEGDR